ncbi:hypothetical protein Golomagni_00237 [Golovinomyces magnicellulatus]|nr:hypothetical protein Golomagni_00237 [Golovinomyces magnicellulatus]
MNLEEHLNLGRTLLNYTDVPDERFCQPPLEWIESKKSFLQSVQIWYTKLSKFLIEYQNLLRNNEERNSNFSKEPIKIQKKKSAEGLTTEVVRKMMEKMLAERDEEWEAKLLKEKRKWKTY